jgi:acylphosphatase
MAAGEDMAVIKLISWARRGPPRASVERVNIAIGEGEFDGFAQWASC